MGYLLLARAQYCKNAQPLRVIAFTHSFVIISNNSRRSWSINKLCPFLMVVEFGWKTVLPFLTLATTTAVNPTVSCHFVRTSAFIRPSWRVPSKLLHRPGLDLRRSTCSVTDTHRIEFLSRLKSRSSPAPSGSPRALPPFRTLMRHTPLNLARSVRPTIASPFLLFPHAQPPS